jgi:hypothetical protein
VVVVGRIDVRLIGLLSLLVYALFERRERIPAVGDSSIRLWHRASAGCRGFTGPVPPPLLMSALAGK